MAWFYSLTERWSSKQIGLAALILLFAGLHLFVARPVINQWLTSAVRSEARQWAELVFDGLEEAAQCVAANTTPSSIDAHVHEHARLAGHFEAAISSGRLHQIDVINPACDCLVSIISPFLEYSDRPQGSNLRGREGPAGQPIVADIERESVKTIAALHTLLEAQSSIRFHSGPRKNAIPFNPDNVIHQTPDTGARIALYTYPSTSGERLMGSVTKTRTLIGGHTLTLRLVQDITHHALAYKGIFWTLAVVLTGLTSGLIIGAYRAVVSSRRAEEMSDQQARYLAERDPLTGTLNRYGFGKKAKCLIDRCMQTNVRACLVQIDANKFKEINDVHGHHIGDLALTSLADLLSEYFPPDALIARLGGDEFAVLLAEDKIPKTFRQVFSNIPSSTTATDESTGEDIAVSYSAGYAILPDDGETLEDLMKAADLALYSVKKDQRSGFRGYSQGMTDAFERRLWEIKGIQEAAESGEIIAHYQPIVNAQTGAVEGVEALARWRHPTLGILAPGRFEHALVDANSAAAITREMAEIVVKDLAFWHSKGHNISAGLNLGETDLKNAELVEKLSSMVKSHNLPARSLAIEVTENAANMFNLDELKPTLKSMRDAGMFIALDDFGTGGSSISILKLLPCTALKIDKSFVTGLVDDPRDYAIVQALTGLGHDMNLKVIAEGVETEQQRAILRRIGVDMLQGHLMSKAVPAHEMTRYLEEWSVAEVVRNFPSRAVGA